MTLTVAHVTPLVALIAGILILIVPRLLNYIVAIYLILVGLIGLSGINHASRRAWQLLATSKMLLHRAGSKSKATGCRISLR